jgi:FMN phosphatase YigB (HAD superfamily)
MAKPDSNVLVLDAMGVIYEVGDDVADLLVPFIRENRGTIDAAAIDAAYLEASLGKISAFEFWTRVGVSPELEDRYLSRFLLSNGLDELLTGAVKHFERVVCLSNDVSEWSRKLRRSFDLERSFHGWYISGDLGCRKPDAAIFQAMLDDLAVDSSRVYFIDDRLKNLQAAAALGIQSVYYNPYSSDGGGNGYRTITRLAAILDS